ncbi:MAG: FAD/NAD(P)-binding protein [Xanthomonadales bacterium]|nr:FAD/NAD(P)-binding protein [Xanthomonadales bacterium]
MAHALAREGRRGPAPAETGENYDLVIVGGGISGLSAAWYYRQARPDARILVLENHDDFGGHAKRNEFHQGGLMRLAWGGVFNLEIPLLSDLVKRFLADLGVNIRRMRRYKDFDHGRLGRKGPAIWFDEETYGRNHLATGCSLRGGSLEALAAAAPQFPLDAASRDSIVRFCRRRCDIRQGMSAAEVTRLMHGTAYRDFLVRHGGLTREAARLFDKTTDGYWGVRTYGLSVAECEGAGLPMRHLLGGEHETDSEYEVAMFPDGNASVARLLVRRLIPAVSPGSGVEDIVTARFDYRQLDVAGRPVRIRLDSTVVQVEDKDGGIVVNYVRGGTAERVRAGQCVLACWHPVIPHICPQLPEAQKQAQRYQVKRPLLLTNVLLRNSKAHDRLGISGAYCPGRLHGATWLCKGVESPEYRHPRGDDGPVAMMFWGMPPSGSEDLSLRDQHRAGRRELQAMPFDAFEREVRTVCDGMLGPAGFDVERDILAMTVNRWPHGYAYDYLDLWDPEFAEGTAPHEIARRRFGNIAIANADAGANAYTHVAIEQAHRAVGELLAL